jgi:hypothetical protein
MELETPAPRDPRDPRDPRGAGVSAEPEHGTFVLGGRPDSNPQTRTPDPTPTPAPAPSRRKLLYGALGVAVVAVGGGTAVALSSGGGQKRNPAPSGST